MMLPEESGITRLQISQNYVESVRDRERKYFCRTFNSRSTQQADEADPGDRHLEVAHRFRAHHKKKALSKLPL